MCVRERWLLSQAAIRDGRTSQEVDEASGLGYCSTGGREL
jgi:hypothetical protein